MNDQDAERFLDTYRRLEAAAERLVGCDSRSGAIMKLTRHRDFERYRDELDYCRQVRNLLTHEAKINGSYGVIPAEPLQSFLARMVRLAEHPPVVSDRMTPVSRLLTAAPADSVWAVMEKMKQGGFSHVPLLTRGVVTGLFSVGTVFQAVLDRSALWNESTCIGDLADYLPIGNHLSHGYAFVRPELPLSKARDRFDRAYEQNQRIKLLLVTAHGRPDEKLLGVISPYDLLDRE